MTIWNPRYKAYCRANGIGDPANMIELDREKYPGGCMVGFMQWMDDQWTKFDTFMEVKNRQEAHASHDYHDRFDLWLEITTA